MNQRQIPLQMTIPAHDVAGALRQVAEKILWDDLDAGRLTPIVAAAVKDAADVPIFMDGMKIGMEYAFALILTGRLNMTLLECERTEP